MLWICHQAHSPHSNTMLPAIIRPTCFHIQGDRHIPRTMNNVCTSLTQYHHWDKEWEYKDGLSNQNPLLKLGVGSISPKAPVTQRGRDGITMEFNYNLMVSVACMRKLTIPKQVKIQNVHLLALCSLSWEGQTLFQSFLTPNI